MLLLLCPPQANINLRSGDKVQVLDRIMGQVAKNSAPKETRAKRFGKQGAVVSSETLVLLKEKEAMEAKAKEFKDVAKKKLKQFKEENMINEHAEALHNLDMAREEILKLKKENALLRARIEGHGAPIGGPQFYPDV